MAMTNDADIDVFIRWFQSNGGYIDTGAMGITEFSGCGRGGVALREIPEGYTLFTLPRTMTLSTRTSLLPSLIGRNAWRAHGLHKGWLGLILCMMWEDAWAHESDDGQGQGHSDTGTKWGPYLRTLPTSFDTPMFWSAEELEELRGTTVVDKIGCDDAERAYFEQVVPAIKTFPTLFPPSHHGSWYSIDAYHRAGSRVLSRSFSVARWKDDEQLDDQDYGEEDREGESAADAVEDIIEPSTFVDDAHFSMHEDPEGEPLSGSEDDEDDPSDVAMVPMADILNAKWGSENAKLFHEPLVLRMVATKKIKKGEQIFNTYGDPPNSDLLRRYGHVDLVQLSSASPANTPILDGDGDTEMEVSGTTAEILHLGNPSDVVEIRADLIVDVIQRNDLDSKTKDMRARIEWWLDEGEDDAFVLSLPESNSDTSAVVPPALISLARLLILSERDFISARSKGKLPKGNLKSVGVKEVKQVLAILHDVIKQREGVYIGGSIEEDEYLLYKPETMSKRKRYAVIVRLGEKRILREAGRTLSEMLAKSETTSGAGSNNGKDDGKVKGTDKVRKHVTNGAEGDHGRKRARKK